VLFRPKHQARSTHDNNFDLGSGGSRGSQSVTCLWRSNRCITGKSTSVNSVAVSYRCEILLPLNFVISTTNLIQTPLFHFIEFQSLDMFRALLAHPQEALHKTHLQPHTTVTNPAGV
jgi:hypothetical protein